MKWHKAVDTPMGRGLRVAFDSGGALVIAKGIDDHLHIVSTNGHGVSFSVAASGALVVAPKLPGRKVRNGKH